MRKRNIFSEMKESLEGALAYERGERVDLRTTELPPPAKRLRPQEIRQIRRSLRASQPVFARLLNVSPNTVRGWEQGVRRPRQAALKLLNVARRHPEVLMEA